MQQNVNFMCEVYSAVGLQRRTERCSTLEKPAAKQAYDLVEFDSELQVVGRIDLSNKR